MKHVALSFAVSARVRFTLKELSLLTKLSKSHYDAHCRSFSIERLENGWPGKLAGLTNATRNVPESDVLLSFNDLDTMAKILEQARYLPTEKEQTAGLLLYTKIRGVLTAINAAYQPDTILQAEQEESQEAPQPV